MPLTEFLLLIVAIGVVLYVINKFIPMEATIKKILNIVVIVVLVLFVLQLFGILPVLSHMRIGR